MGEVAEMMLDGTLCQICGGLMEDLINENGDDLKEPPGYPRTCEDCKEYEQGVFEMIPKFRVWDKDHEYMEYTDKNFNSEFWG